MIISKTPYRISFFGGGTDFPEWFTKNSGAVLSTTIDKYCYLSCRCLPPFFPHKHRFVYSRVEDIVNIEDIQHPCLKHVFKWLNITNGLEIHHDGDLPARAGLGSSSSFTVGLLNVMNAYQNSMSSKKQLAESAIFVERELIKESGGWQDQVAVSFGGFNFITFNQNETFEVAPVILKKDTSVALQSHLLLFFTGIQRSASKLERKKLSSMEKQEELYHATYELVDDALSAIVSPEPKINDFGKLMHEGWRLKKKVGPGVSTRLVDEAYEVAQSKGALGGKLLGAGGGGFLLIFAEPSFHEQIITALSKFTHVPFNFEYEGSKIALYQPHGL